MAYLPLPNPSNLSNQNAPPLQSLFLSETIDPLEVSALFSELHQILDRGAPLDSILSAITDAAGAMTGASGIALALRSKGTVVCRARAGEIAPYVGAQLNADSGISGECFRSGHACRCDDTQTDDRVDPEVCRFMGIRSIAVVPVQGLEETVGILEAFSTRPRAFNREHVSLLRCLAEIAEVANAREFEAELGSGTRVAEIPETLVRPASIVARIREVVPTADLFAGRDSKGTRRYWMIGGAAVVLLLMSAIIWISLSGPDGGAVASQQTIQPPTAPQEDSGRSASAVLTRNSPASRVQPRADRRATRDGRHSDPTLDPEQPAEFAVLTSNLKVAGASTSPPLATSEVSGLPPPAVPAIAPDFAGLAPLVSKAAGLPAADLIVSQGVTDATVVHKVLPIYPSEARTKNLGGTVVLEATIAEDGSTRDLKVISGTTLLAEAATDAVRQWRYRPSLLNGKPVAVQRQITVVFKAR